MPSLSLPLSARLARPLSRRPDAPHSPLESTGAFWPARSLLFADFAKAKFYAGGAVYASEAAMNTALGVTKSGEARSFPVYVAPGASELLADGGFTSGIDSWVEAPAHAANGDIAVVSNQLVATRNGNAATYRCSRPVTLETTKAFRAIGTRVGTTGSLLSAFLAAAGGADLNASISAGAGSNGAMEVDFAPSSTAFNIGLNVSGTVSSVGSITTDDYSLKECLPIAGFVQGAFSAEIKATAPATHATIKCIAHWGDDGGQGGLGTRNSVRLIRNIAGNIILDVLNNAASQASLDLGNVADGAAFTVRFAVTNNRFSGSLNGATVVTDTAGTLPPLAAMRLGRDSMIGSVAAWDGTIQSFTLWPEALADAELPNPFDAINILGDSRAVAEWSALATAVSPRSVVSNATGGENYTTTITVAQALPDYVKRRNQVVVQYRNTNETLQQCLDGARGVLAAIGHARVYLEPMFSGIPESQQSVVDGYNAALLTELAAYSLSSSDQAAFLANLADRTVGDGIHDDAEHQAIRAAYAKAFFGF